MTMIDGGMGGKTQDRRDDCWMLRVALYSMCRRVALDVGSSTCARSIDLEVDHRAT